MQQLHHSYSKLISAISVMLMAMVLFSCGTKNSMESGDEAYRLRSYFKAKNIYSSLFENAKTMEEQAVLSFKIGNCYRLMNDWQEAINQYEKASDLGYADPEMIYYEAECYKQMGNFEKAKELFSLFQREKPGSNKASSGLQSVDLYEDWKKRKAAFTVDRSDDLNSDQNEYALAFALDEKEIFFTSDRLGSTGEAVYERTGLPYSDLYYSKWNARDKKWEIPEKVDESVNTSFNEGVSAFYQGKGNADFLYYTQCNGRRGNERNCKILVSKRIGADWQEPDTLAFCKDSLVNYGHPAISEDGNSMIFSANMINSYGGHDLYITTYDQRDNKWSKPENLGRTVNSKGDEMFPFLFKDNTLYFSSDGHPGLGAFDVFMSEKKNGQWTKPQNLRGPVNSGADDISFIFSKDGTSGYFASNREGKGDDIYSFILLPKVCAIAGKVFNARNEEVIANAEVQLIQNGNVSSTTQSAEDGSFFFPNGIVNCDKNYELMVSGGELFFSSRPVEMNVRQIEVSDTLYTEIPLSPIPQKDEEIAIEGIFYGLDSFNLRKESLVVLDSLARVLDNNPGFVIELASHTDCRASMAYNDTLSQKRAQSVVDYLVSKDINRARLVPKGYGERRLVNDCECENGIGKGETCSEEEHQANRRTTFTILKTDYGKEKE